MRFSALILSAALVFNTNFLLAQNKKFVKVSDKWAWNDGALCDLFVNVKSFKTNKDTLFYEAHYIEQENKNLFYKGERFLLFSTSSTIAFAGTSRSFLYNPSEPEKIERENILSIYKQTLKKKKASLLK
ncbi:MAG: hypothetical protein EAZ92_00210 [Candidatus Kapaibacterium sp.]|nr:MAG: hypothetical protein EAZ92_00210 [Candidatus Kapabacteria bacterium]